ncbi:MAG: DUF3108 domain-containing protein [bacterium]|nr:DUF3108 domain-containing protein [bacterium]
MRNPCDRCLGLTVFAILLVLPAAGDAFADEGGAAADTAAAASVFGPGELMEFSIDYGVINAGNGSLECLGITTYQGRPVYHMESKANSNRFFSSFYKVRDKIVSYIDTATLRSLYFHKRLREGDYKKTVEISFDHANNVARYADGRTFETMPGTQDVLSAFYYVRNLDLAPGKVYSVPAHSSRRTYDLRVIVHGRERVEVEAGTWECFVVEPVIEGEGLFKHEGKITLYISDDARRVPVLIKTKVPVGSIDVQLTRYRPGRPLNPLIPGEQP